MDTIQENLANLKNSRMASIPISGLISRNPVAYKWKAPFRSWVLRETVFWRLHDLLVQSYLLHQHRHGLGARILLRSGFETLAVLIYLNQLMQQVLDEKLNFHLFGEKTTTLLLGSRDGSTMHKSLNIMTILERCDKRYHGLAQLYAILSESAHPNFEGLCTGYSKIDHSEYETNFSNRWMEIYGETHLGSMDLCMTTFHHEYNEVWVKLMENMESWIEANDVQLEATRSNDLRE